MTAVPQPAAGWYADPTLPTQLRWWDGATWTEHVNSRTLPQASSSPEQPASNDLWSLFPRRVAAEPFSQEPTLLGGVTSGQALGGFGVFVLVVVIASAISGLLAGVIFLGGVAIFVYAGVRDTSGRGDASAAWFESLGLTVGGDSQSVTAALRAAGSPVRLSGSPGLRGTLWTAAPDAIVSTCTVPRGDEEDRYTVVSVPLRSTFATRIVGVSMEAVSGFTGRTFDAWKPVEFEASREALGYVVRAHPQQDELVTWELFDPGFLISLQATREAADPGVRSTITALLNGTIGGKLGFVGFAVADGLLEVMFSAHLLSAVTMERSQLARGNPAGRYAGASDTFVEAVRIARDIHQHVDGMHP